MAWGLCNVLYSKRALPFEASVDATLQKRQDARVTEVRVRIFPLDTHRGPCVTETGSLSAMYWITHIVWSRPPLSSLFNNDRKRGMGMCT